MNAGKPPVYGLSDFGLNLNQLTALGRLKVKLHVCLRHVNERSLFRLKPSQRVERIRRHYTSLLSRLRMRWADGPIQISWIRRQPRGFVASVEARRICHLLRMPEVGDIWLDEIPSRKRRRKQPKKRWFAVQARFAIQVEGQTTGLQSYEDRIVMVRAFGFEDAEDRLQPEFKKYGRPYLNAHGCMVRWKFERVLDVYEIGDETIDPRGMEVFSVLARRRMKPEFAWKAERKEPADRQ